MEHIIVAVVGMVCILMAYIVGRHDGKWREREVLIRMIYKVSLDGAASTKYHIFLVKTELCRKLRKEWV